MNGIFSAVFILATLFCLIRPDCFLPALTSGATKAVELTLTLCAVYAVWLGFFGVLQKSGLSTLLQKPFTPLAKRLFHTTDRETVSYLSGNLTANLLGLPGAPTPQGINAVRLMESAHNHRGSDVLFVLNATSIQLFPTTVVALRATLGSVAPADIFLPTLLTSLLSTLSGLLLLKVFRK